MVAPKWLTVLVPILAVVAVVEAVMVWRLDSELQQTKQKVRRLSDQFADISFEATPNQMADDQTERPWANQRRWRSNIPTTDPKQEAREKRVKQTLTAKKLSDMLMIAAGFPRNSRRPDRYVAMLTKLLDLQEDQKREIELALNRVNDAMMRISKETVGADIETFNELLGVMRSDVPKDQKLPTLKSKLSSISTPNADGTYWDLIEQVKDSFNADLEDILEEEQFETFTAMPSNPAERQAFKRRKMAMKKEMSSKRRKANRKRLKNGNRGRRARRPGDHG